MSEKKQFTIQEFAHLTGIKRDNLRFYDRIGLLSPQTRGDNKYRYYSRMQLSNAYLIYTLRSLGVSIEEIRQYLTKDTSDSTLAFFLKQQQRVDEELKRLQETRGIIELYAQFVKEELAYVEGSVYLKEKQQEPIFMCPIIPEHMDDDEAIILAYDYASSHHINTGHPLGAIISQEEMMNEELCRVQRYYFLLHKGKKTSKNAGLYAVAYSNSSLESMRLTYHILIDFIEKNSLEICGDAYEEYLLDDFSLPSDHQHNVRIEIPVCHKEEIQ